jgi:hypothetical protein
MKLSLVDQELLAALSNMQDHVADYTQLVNRMMEKHTKMQQDSRISQLERIGYLAKAKAIQAKRDGLDEAIDILSHYLSK